MAGLSPSPPNLQMEMGLYELKSRIMNIQCQKKFQHSGRLRRRRCLFSLHCSTQRPRWNDAITIIFHGFANPFFESYVDWVETLASRGTAVAFIQYPSDVMPPGHDISPYEEAGMSNHPYHIQGLQ